MNTYQTKIDSEVWESIDEIKPKYITTTAFINQLLEEGIEYKKLKKQNMFNYIYTLNNKNINLEEQNEEPKEKINKKERVIPDDLKPFTELINDFWQVKKGSKSFRAWKQQNTEYRKFIDKYNSKVLTEQLEAGILNGTWASLSVKNYEQYYLKNNKFKPPEPIENHPNQKVFKASDQNLPKTLAEINAEKIKRGQ